MVCATVEVPTKAARVAEVLGKHGPAVGADLSLGSFHNTPCNTCSNLSFACSNSTGGGIPVHKEFLWYAAADDTPAHRRTCHTVLARGFGISQW